MSSRLVGAGLMVGLGLLLSGCNSDDTSAIPSNAIDAMPSVALAVGMVGGHSQTISITFDTSNGQPISDLVVTGLTSLPSGWSGPASFACSIVISGSGCVLNLSYAPNAGSKGTLELGYTFTNTAGAAMSATVAIPYTATSSDNVVATASPTGQIAAVVNDGTVPVTVTFTTDDGLSASNLSLTSALSSLPAGWSSMAQTFSCAAVSTGNACQLSLAYTPSSAGADTLTLNYGYTDDAGEAKAGSINISYTATTDDNVIYAQSPSGQVNASVNGSATAVTVTFNTDDGQPGTSLAVTSGLGTLPADWSGPGSFSCATISSGGGCQLSLTYAPTSLDSGTLTLGYSYTNDAGHAGTGTVNVSYAAVQPHLYVTNFYSSTVDDCTFGAGGTLSACTPTPSSNAMTGVSGMVFDGNNVYMTDFDDSFVTLCTVNADGTFNPSCTQVYNSSSDPDSPWSLAIGGGYLYIGSGNGHGVTYCQIDAQGLLGNCAATASGVTYAFGIAIGGGYAYLSGLSGTLDVCAVNSDGSLTACAATGSGFNFPQFITLSGGYAYIGNQGAGAVAVCTIGSDGALTSCANSPVGNQPNAVAILGNYAYVDDDNDNIYQCTLGSGGATLTNCAVSNGGATFAAPQQMGLH
ncbi:MAG TPA: hypothetical protein VN660_14110 [Steroidobacteraceae bacterium]|nr:hypothetical protein [Steroidobacteraceae bacterium]